MERQQPQAPSGAPITTYRHDDFSVDDLLLAKAQTGDRVVVCIPARNEQATIGAVVDCIRRTAMSAAPIVDEILVVDDASTDGTAGEAAKYGAVVESGPGLGKGEAMRLARGRGADVIVYLDGDVVDMGEHFVLGLLGPILTDDAVMLVKGCYQRPIAGDPTGGGRVTELVAKPLLAVLFPELVGVGQPLAGETAVRAEVLDKVELDGGYAVEMGLLIDVFQLWGPLCIAQVQLGERLHRNRSLHELAPQARDVIAAALARTPIGAGLR